MQINFGKSLLIASPKIIQNTFFNGALVYIDKYSPSGTFGFIVNKPTDIKVIELLKTLDITKGKNYQSICDEPVYIGGPVNQTSLYIMYLDPTKEEDATSEAQTIKISSSEKMLTDLCNGVGPTKFLIMLGRATWGADQLEQEYQNNAWIYLECVTDIVFHSNAEQRAKLAAMHLGFDLNTLIAS